MCILFRTRTWRPIQQFSCECLPPGRLLLFQLLYFASQPQALYLLALHFCPVWILAAASGLHFSTVDGLESDAPPHYLRNETEGGTPAVRHGENNPVLVSLLAEEVRHVKRVIHSHSVGQNETEKMVWLQANSISFH